MVKQFSCFICFDRGTYTGCPECGLLSTENHVSDVLNATSQPKAPTSTADPVNRPQHYQFFPDLEAIEVIARSTTQEQFYGYCLGNRLKYRLRAGNKDKLEQDIAKSDKYLELYEKYKGLCYRSGDDVITPVPMLNLEDLEDCYA